MGEKRLAGEAGHPTNRWIDWLVRVVLALVGLGVLTIVAIAVAMWKYSRTPEGAEMVRSFGEMRAKTEAGAKAPGTTELRQLGCLSASVIDGERPDQGAGAATGSRPTTYVGCQPWPTRTPPSCEQVARTYHDAVRSPRHDYVVYVMPAACRELYSAAGAKLGALPVGP